MTESAAKELKIWPYDEYNKRLIENTHPLDYQNPKPAKKYNLVVIGAGTAGLVTAAGAAGLGAKVALVERHLMGGDCLNTGCVPSKSIIAPAKIISTIKKASNFGIDLDNNPQVDFEKVMQRLRKIRADISNHDSVERFSGLGIDVFIGEAKFVDSGTVEVGETKLNFKKAVIASGARAVAPEIAGIDSVDYLTNETVFNLTKLPKSLAVIGAGPIGSELAQAFSRLGTKVHLIDRGPHILGKEDKDAAKIIQDVFVDEGIHLILNAQIKKISVNGNKKIIELNSKGENCTLEVEQILVGAGRKANVEDLNLEAVGVNYNERGIEVNDHLRSTNKKIYAAGDVCMNWKFTHAADAAARIVIQNSLFFGKKKLSDLRMPWATYTDPEVAHVGFYQKELEEKNTEFDTYKIEMSAVDRAQADGDTKGFLKILTKKGSDQILGATIVGTNAGDLISEITTAITNNIGLGKISSVIHPYPTKAEIIKKAADAYNRTRLTPKIKSLMEKYFSLTR